MNIHEEFPLDVFGRKAAKAMKDMGQPMPRLEELLAEHTALRRTLRYSAAKA
jgi:hypothetical protein